MLFNLLNISYPGKARATHYHYDSDETGTTSSHILGKAHHNHDSLTKSELIQTKARRFDIESTGFNTLPWLPWLQGPMKPSLHTSTVW